MGTGAAAEREIVYNLEVDPRTIDPVLNSAVDGSNVIYNLFEGLVRIGFDDAPEAGCAEKWESSEDGMSWTFHLRPGLKWSDGDNPVRRPNNIRIMLDHDYCVAFRY